MDILTLDLKKVLVAGTFTAWLLTAPPLTLPAVYGYEVGQCLAPAHHEEVTETALKATICPANLKVVVLGAAGEANRGDLQGDDSYRHFKDKNLLKTLNYVEREKRKVLNFCATADVDQKSRVRALYHFGLILHTLQDFYSNSNYLELKLDELRKEHHALNSDSLYSIPLIDWNRFLSLLRNGNKTSIVVEGFDKADAGDPEARMTAGGITYLALAKELAVRETERQWLQLESLIKAKLQGSGAAVSVSLRNAGCPEQVVSDVLKGGENLVPEI
ncbi:MAG: hypothetical protein C5B53_12510 [Candidatus Melainabacteria bacterium]|nr:MAG: hypothetical protein C5B53_12510 [Candidatus Melainabacteria bacterium]